jgi:hypothetical protein
MKIKILFGLIPDEATPPQADHAAGTSASDEKQTDSQGKKINPLLNGLALFLCGWSVGWLIGMSRSPVIHDVLIAVFSVITTLLLALIGLKSETSRFTVAFRVLPLGLFLFSLSVGAACGNYTRSNDLLGIDEGRFLTRWQKLLPAKATAADSLKLMERLYQLAYSVKTTSQSQGDSGTVAQPTSGLFNGSSTLCGELNRTGEPLRASLKRIDSPLIKRLMAKNPTDEELILIRNELCPDLSK